MTRPAITFGWQINLGHILEALIEAFGHQSEASPTSQAEDRAEQQVFESP